MVAPGRVFPGCASREAGPIASVHVIAEPVPYLMLPTKPDNGYTAHESPPGLIVFPVGDVKDVLLSTS